MQLELRQATDYTFILIDNWGNTQMVEAFICNYNPKTEIYTVRVNNQRQTIYMDAKYIRSGLVFLGTELELAVDTGLPFQQGNRCFNLVTSDPKALRTFLSENCLTLSEIKKTKITWRTPATGIYLYPNPC